MPSIRHRLQGALAEGAMCSFCLLPAQCAGSKHACVKIIDLDTPNAPVPYVGPCVAPYVTYAARHTDRTPYATPYVIPYEHRTNTVRQGGNTPTKRPVVTGVSLINL